MRICLTYIYFQRTCTRGKITLGTAGTSIKKIIHQAVWTFSSSYGNALTFMARQKHPSDDVFRNTACLPACLISGTVHFSGPVACDAFPHISSTVSKCIKYSTHGSPREQTFPSPSQQKYANGGRNNKEGSMWSIKFFARCTREEKDRTVRRRPGFASLEKKFIRETTMKTPLGEFRMRARFLSTHWRSYKKIVEGQLSSRWAEWDSRFEGLSML